MTPEGKLLAAFRRVLKKNNVWHLRMDPPPRVGVHDIFACIDGKLIGIELKSAKGKLTKTQIAEDAKLKNAGAHSLVIRNTAQIEDFCEQYGLQYE